MSKELCVIHGNCQGDVLNILLSLSEPFSRRFETRRVVNYLEDAPAPELLSRCSLFLYQYLSPRWGAKATDHLLAKLPPSSESLCFPNMFFKGYWPFWRKDESVIEFADSFLESLLSRGLPAPAILSVYNKCSPELAGDFNKTVESTLAIEKEKEKKTPVKYVHLIEESWRERQMFITINHPSMALHIHAANSVLKELGFPPLPKPLTDRIPHPYNEFWLPIHPAAGKRLSLSFAGPERKYNCFSQKLTHAEYTNFYLACRMNNVQSLTSALAQTRPVKKS